MTQTLKALLSSKLKSAYRNGTVPRELPVGFEELKPEKESPPRPTEAFEKTMETAIHAFRKSDIGQKLAHAADMTMDDILACAPQVIAIPEMQAVVRQASNPANLVAGPQYKTDNGLGLREAYAPKTVLVPFAVFLDIEVDATVIVGYSYDIDNSDLFSVYATASLGISASTTEVVAGAGVGITAMAYSELSGVSCGFDLSAVAGIGFLIDGSIGLGLGNTLLLEPQCWAFCCMFVIGAGPIGGVGGSIGAYLGATMMLYDDVMPVTAQPDGIHLIELQELTCTYKQSSGLDKVYLNITTDADNYSNTYTYPLWDHFSIDETKHGDIPEAHWQLGYAIKMNEKCYVQLMCNGEALTTYELTTDVDTDPGDNVVTKQISGANMPPVVASYDDPGGNHVGYDLAVYTHV
ncbi:MAG: hypothetical protein ACRBBS_02020 [Thalassovita sp.]